MNVVNIRESLKDFHLLQTTARLQTAVMFLQCGEASSDKLEVHPDSDQMIVVLEGELFTEAGDERQTIGPGQMLMIPAGTPHRLKNAGSEPAFAVTVYGPPAYAAGEA